MDYIGYHSYLDEVLPPESPNLYGLHPNAEIGFLTSTSENLFKTILELQPRDSSGVGGGGQTRDEKVKQARLLHENKSALVFPGFSFYAFLESKTKFL